MLVNQHVSLKGKFRFDVYKSDGTLRYSVDKDNFITSTGLNYPSVFAYADCFRFISLGSGTTGNSIKTTLNNGWGTTGLQSGLSQYSYIGSRTCEGDRGYESEACGFLEEGSGVRLTRAWRVPTGSDVFPTAFAFKEFMVSPGRPFVVDVDGSKACHCFESTTFGLNGKDGANIAQYYSAPPICSGDKAFARVVKTINVVKDDFLVVTYDLNVSSVNTGIQNVQVNIVNNTTANWSGTLRAKYNLVHHGVKLIDNGVNSYFGREQIPNFAFGTDYGESFVPPWGAPMEPTCDISHVQAYISTDNVQFLTNRISGGRWTDDIPDPLSGSGVLAWRHKPTTDGADNLRWINIRQNPENPYYPDPTDYTTETTATALGFDVSYVTGSRSQHTPLEDTFTKNSRFRTGNYSFQFWGNNEVDFHSKPVRAMVLAYYDQSQPGTMYPFFDMIFANRTGQYPPAINTGPKTYDLPSDTNNPPTGYFYVENGGILTMTFKMSWSSPCDPAVDGC